MEFSPAEIFLLGGCEEKFNIYIGKNIVHKLRVCSKIGFAGWISRVSPVPKGESRKILSYVESHLSWLKKMTFFISHKQIILSVLSRPDPKPFSVFSYFCIRLKFQFFPFIFHTLGCKQSHLLGNPCLPTSMFPYSMFRLFWCLERPPRNRD